jgi:hypothetical protein
MPDASSPRFASAIAWRELNGLCSHGLVRPRPRTSSQRFNRSARATLVNEIGTQHAAGCTVPEPRQDAGSPVRHHGDDLLARDLVGGQGVMSQGALKRWP